MKNLHIGIRPTILTIFTLIVLLTLFVTLGLQYYFSQTIALESVEKDMKKTASNTSLKIDNIENSVTNIVTITELLDESTKKPEELLTHPLTNKFTTFMSSYPFIYAMYIGYENGDFYEVINLDVNPSLRVKYNSNHKERWLLLKVSQKATQRIQENCFLNKDLKILRTTSEISNYNPTKRPWYKKAFNDSNIIKTEPYQFSNFDSLGLTYAKKIKNTHNIIGVDVSLKTISSLLKSETDIKGSLSFLLDQDKNKLLASNVDHHISKEEISEFINQIKLKNLSISFNEKIYFISNSILVSPLGTKSQLITLTPKEIIMAPYNEEITYAIILNLFVMLLLSPVMFYLTKLVSKPIHALEIENEKIKNRKFDEVIHINTKISELSSLSGSLVSMSTSIKEYEEAQLKLMDSFIELIAGAIDAKSEYNGEHCNKVPIISIELAKIASEAKNGVFEDFTIENEDQMREISIAAWLHDCGKVTTPEYIIDKATKLETIYNRIHEIRMRFEIVYRDLIIDYHKQLQNTKDKKQLENNLKIEQQKLIDDFNFVATSNVGGEYMDQKSKDRIKMIAQRTWQKYFDDSIGLSYDEELRYEKNDSNIEYILANKKSHIIPRTNFSQEEHDKYNFKMEVPKDLYNLGEIYNLTVERGTLTKEDRFKISEHVIMSIKMLEMLPFPENLKNVPQYAGGHHETLIGTGYPRQLTKEQLSIPARIIALADVFEALSSSDRPYKTPKKLSEVIKILSFMVKDKHIDKDIFELFLTSGFYKKYAEENLTAEQIDEVDVNSYIS